jgi:hypothetical protein
MGGKPNSNIVAAAGSVRRPLKAIRARQDTTFLLMTITDEREKIGHTLDPERGSAAQPSGQKSEVGSFRSSPCTQAILHLVLLDAKRTLFQEHVAQPF